jgi:hypothetical protein
MQSLCEQSCLLYELYKKRDRVPLRFSLHIPNVEEELFTAFYESTILDYGLMHKLFATIEGVVCVKIKKNVLRTVADQHLYPKLK